MIRRITLVFLFAALTVSAVRADYSVAPSGQWPSDWPKELEPLRKQASTYEGPMLPLLHYAIPFTKREDFEAAWPHLVNAKSKGAPIILMRPNRTTKFFGVSPAGVLIQSPPTRIDRKTSPEAPIKGRSDARSKWRNTTFIQLVVDGDIVDLNRIEFPDDTPIVDERFK